MPVLESTEHIAPRSVLRHRPISSGNGHAGKRSVVTTAATPTALKPKVQRASRPRTQTSAVPVTPVIPVIPVTPEDVEVDEWQRVEDDGDAAKIQLHVPIVSRVRRAGYTTTSKTLPKTPLPGVSIMKRLSLRNAHPLLYLGIGMLGMLALWTIVVGFFSWYNTTMDDIHYGRPRTFQTDYYVGHNESAATPSHFMAINLHGHIEVLEFPGGDASHARIFLGPQLFTPNNDLIVVTLRFTDVNGDHKPDMIVNFQGSQVVFINDQGTFRPLRVDERRQVEQFLQQHPG